ncbi:MAG TPA: ABC transporter permease [Thermoanaerobaculia bacterium]|nr:ABC transporter permease [Thermoanaerobaculia bacterium]
MTRWLDLLRHRLRSLFRTAAVERDLDRELRAHLAAAVEEKVRAGMAPEQARREALREFGSVAEVAEACRDVRRVSFVQNLARDLKYACRSLLAQPVLLVAATTSIGLGVGANLTIFALAAELLLSVPTASRPEELVHIRTGNGSHVSYPAWRGLDASGALAGIAGYDLAAGLNWRGPDETVALTPLIVTANFFDVVGAPVARGRAFSADEARIERDPHLLVVSHGFWQRRLGGDPDVAGSRLILNGRPYTVVGVLPADVRSIAGYGLKPDVWVAANRALVPLLDDPKGRGVMLVGRRRSGQSVGQARAALAVVAAQLGEQLGDDELKIVTRVSPVGGLGQVEEVQTVGAFFVVLMVVAGLVLAIACANVAGLLLARATTRRRALAMRVALGASRGRLIQQLLTEGLVLAGAGTIFGFALMAVAGSMLARISLPLPLPIALGLAYDGRLLLLAIGLVVLTTLLCSLVPALKATRASLVPSLKEADGVSTHRRITTRNLLVVGQVAVSLTLLVTAVIFLRNLERASSLDPGFDVDPVFVAQVTFVEGKQGTPALPAAALMVDRLRTVPGVREAALAGGVPLTLYFGDWSGNELRLSGRAEPFHAEYSRNFVGPGYFEVLGIDLVAGRTFTTADRAGGPRVVVVNQEFVRRYFEGRSPIGRQIVEGDRPPMEVVGVVADSLYRSRKARPRRSISRTCRRIGTCHGWCICWCEPTPRRLSARRSATRFVRSTTPPPSPWSRSLRRFRSHSCRVDSARHCSACSVLSERCSLWSASTASSRSR